MKKNIRTITSQASTTLYYGQYITHFGLCTIGIYSKHICYLGFDDADSFGVQAYSVRLPDIQLSHQPQMAKLILSRIFEDTHIPLPLLFHGTPFQIKVWKALLKIPMGELVSYQDIAALIQQPKAARAVGQAIAKNAIAYLIPCHRVIKHSGEIGNYRWGNTRKAAIIAWEKNKSASMVKNK